MNPSFLTEDRYRDAVSFLVNASVFLFFSLLLATKYGHSLAMVLMLVATLLAIPLKRNSKIPKEIKFASGFLLFLGFFWSHTFDDLFSLSPKGDYLVRYILGAWLMVVLSKVPINPHAVLYGLSAGGIAAGILATMQYEEMGRAEGFTNAIRFGDLAILMGIISLSAAMLKIFSTKERTFFAIASFFGLLASILSLSRGGWPALIAIPVIFFFIFRESKKIALFFTLSLLPIFLIFINLPPVESRIQEATKQINGYFDEHEQYVQTSLGARLEMWKTALLMGKEKPFTGWGDKNIQNKRLEYVEKSISNPVIMEYNHAHNDFLEMWARRGIIGIIALIGIYVIPILLIISFYRKNKYTVKNNERLTSINKFLVISGVLIYFGYFIFGLSDVFFTFVIGHNFYLFSLIFILSSMQWIQKENSK